MTLKEEKLVIKKYVKSLNDLIKIQHSNGNWDYDEYIYGMLNGLICAKSVLTGEDAKYPARPKKWLKDRKVKSKPKVANGRKS